MTIRLIQGFDYFATTNDPTVPYLDETDTERLLGFRAPANAAGASAIWFINSSGTTEGLSIDATNFRIDGKSLAINYPYEGATYNPQFNGIKHLDLTKTFASTTRAVIGFAIRVSSAPTYDIPILQFFYDDSAEAEQLSLWLTPTGRFYIGNSDFDVTDDTRQANTAVGVGGQSSTGVFRFGTFVYIEVDMNYGTTPETCTVYVNGSSVLSLTSTSVRKNNASKIDGVSIIAPHNQYWGATGDYSMNIDDLYITTGEAPYGPQHIACISTNSTVTAGWSGSVGGSNHNILDQLFNPADLSDYVFNTGATDFELYNCDNAVAAIQSITAVAPTIIASIDSGSDVLNLGIGDQVTTTILNTGANVTVDNINPKFYQSIFATNADALAWTNTLVDQLQMMLDLDP